MRNRKPRQLISLQQHKQKELSSRCEQIKFSNMKNPHQNRKDSKTWVFGMSVVLKKKKTGREVKGGLKSRDFAELPLPKDFGCNGNAEDRKLKAGTKKERKKIECPEISWPILLLPICYSSPLNKRTIVEVNYISRTGSTFIGGR